MLENILGCGINSKSDQIFLQSYSTSTQKSSKRVFVVLVTDFQSVFFILTWNFVASRLTPCKFSYLGEADAAIALVNIFYIGVN